MSELPHALTDIPSNLNYLSPLSFKFTMKRSPTVNYFLHRVNIPGLTLPTVEEPTTFTVIPQPGDKIEWNPLVITFRVDENMENYFEIHRWMVDLARTQEFPQFKSLKDQPDWTGLGITSEITLTILDSHRNPNLTFTFSGCLPTGLGDIVFDAASNDVQYLTATAQFEYVYYTWEKVI